MKRPKSGEKNWEEGVEGAKLGRHGCHVKFGDSRINRSRDIRAAHFVMESDGRRTTPFGVLPENAAACSILLPYPHDGPNLTDSQ